MYDAPLAVTPAPERGRIVSPDDLKTDGGAATISQVALSGPLVVIQPALIGAPRRPEAIDRHKRAVGNTTDEV